MRRTEKLGETEPKAQFPSKGKGLDDDDDDLVTLSVPFHKNLYSNRFNSTITLFGVGINEAK